ncbi:MAG: STN domain-containing protein, partial [Planctomycetota bacterium]
MRTRKAKLLTGTILVGLALAGAAVGQEQAQIDLDVKDKPLHEVVSYIRDVTGAPIELGENRDGLPLVKDDDLKLTIRLDGVHWLTALKLVAESVGAQVKQLGDGRYHVFQPPRYTLSLIDADLGVVVTMIARLGDLNVVFPSDLLRGRKVTLRLTDLRWEKVLEVVVKTSRLVLIPIGKQGKRRITLPEKGVAKKGAGSSGG